MEIVNATWHKTGEKEGYHLMWHETGKENGGQLMWHENGKEKNETKLKKKEENNWP